MKAIVTKPFKDKTNNDKRYTKDNVYEGNEKRIKELYRLGYVAYEEKEPSLLDGNVKEVKEAIAELSKEELEKVLTEEKEDKNRKSVVEHIEELLREGE